MISSDFLPPVTLLLLLLLPLLRSAAAVPSFSATDPRTGRQVQCDSCPPGTYLRAKCTENSGTVCAPCPQGSFTEIWNYIDACLRCGVCALNEEVRTECSAVSDCQCQCKPGYFRSNGMCMLHTECPPGEGVHVQGTLTEDTVCQPCSNSTFSDSMSATQNCTPHRNCQGAGMQQLLRGTVWHDNICISCQDLMSREGSEIIRRILPAFFVHEGMRERKLHRLLHRLRPPTTQRPPYYDPLAEIAKWTRTATAEEIQQLPALVKAVGAKRTSHRLQLKLQNINAQLQRLCN